MGRTIFIGRSFDARQQLFFQRSSKLHEPLNFCLGTIERLDSLAEPLNLRLETIEQLDDLVVLVTKCVEPWVCRHQSAHSLFIFGEPCQQRPDAFDHSNGLRL